MPDIKFFKDGKGNVRQVPASRIGRFKELFPNAQEASQDELHKVEMNKAAQNEQKRLESTDINVSVPSVDKVEIGGSGFGNPFSRKGVDGAIDIASQHHRSDPDVQFRAKYGAYKDNPELHRDEDAPDKIERRRKKAWYEHIGAGGSAMGQYNTPQTPGEDYGETGHEDATRTRLSQQYMDDRVSKQDKQREKDSISDFLTNTEVGRAFVDYDDNVTKYFEELKPKLDVQIEELEQEIKDKASERNKIVNRPVPGTRYGVNPSWLSKEEREKIKAAKSADAREADKIASSDDIKVARETLSELKRIRDAVNDRDKNAFVQLINEGARRLPDAAFDVATFSMRDVAVQLENRQTGDLTRKADDLFAQHSEMVENLYKNPTSMAQDIANGTLGSMKFMAGMAFTGVPASAIISGTTKGVGRVLLKESTNQFLKQSAKKGVGKVVNIAGKNIGEAFVQTVIMPSTWAGALEKNREEPGSFLNAYAKNFIAAFGEVGLERAGDFMPFKFKSKFMQGVTRYTHMNSFLPEIIEEDLQTAWHALFKTGEGEWSDLIDPRNRLVTAATIGLMQAPAVSIETAGGYAAGKHRNARAQRQIRIGLDKNIANMQKVFGDKATQIMEELNDNVEKNLTKRGGDTYKLLQLDKIETPTNNMTEDQKDAMATYTMAYGAMKGMERAKAEEKVSVRNRVKSLVNSNVNKHTGTIIMGNVPNIDTPVAIHGYIQFKPDGSIDHNKSGELFYTDTDGKQKVVSSRHIDLAENADPVQIENEIAQQKEFEVERDYANSQVPLYQNGEQVRFTNQEGNVAMFGEIVGVDDAGSYLVQMEGVPEPQSVEPRQIIPENHLKGVENNSEVKYIDDAGKTVIGVVSDAYTLRGDGMMVIDGKEVSTDNIMGLAENIEDHTQSKETETTQQEAEETEVTPEQQAQQQEEHQKKEFYDTLPRNKKGDLNHNQFTPEQKLKFVEFEYGKERAIAGAEVEVKNAEKRLKTAQTQLNNDPLNAAKIEAEIKAKEELDFYKSYVYEARRQQTEENKKASTSSIAEEVSKREQSRAEQEEAQKQSQAESEATKGVPDVRFDTPQAARNRGFRMVNGVKYERQAPITVENYTQAERKFSDKDVVPVKRTIVEAETLNPSHRNGVANNNFFITEAQPKRRTDGASQAAAESIATNMNPSEITGGVTAYTGAPIVNAHGEVLQGNNRVSGLQLMHADGNKANATKYKQHLIDNAADYGMTPKQVEAMSNPVAVDMAEVNDAEAIRLGQLSAQDTESGGAQRIPAQQTAKLLGKDIDGFVERLFLGGNDNTPISTLLNATGKRALDYLNRKGVINATQYQSALNKDGNLTPEAKADLQNIAAQLLFQKTGSDIEVMFMNLPDKAQKAILQTIHRDGSSVEGERIVKDIQEAIQAYYELDKVPNFAEAKNYISAKEAAMGAAKQTAMFDSETTQPLTRFSNFAIELAVRFKTDNQNTLKARFNALYNDIQGIKTDAFDTSGKTSRVEAINKHFKPQDYVSDGPTKRTDVAGDSRTSQKGQQTEPGRTTTGESVEGEKRSTDSTGRVESDNDVKEKQKIVERISKQLNTEVIVYNTPDDIPTNKKDAYLEKKKASKGWYVGNKVYVVLSNHTNALDVQETLLHEIVGHKGIKDMLGREKHEQLLTKIFDVLPKDVQAELSEKYEGNKYIAADEYIAKLAENYDNLSPQDKTIWEKVKQVIINFIENDLGIKLTEQNVDDVINALLVESKNRLENPAQVEAEIEAQKQAEVKQATPKSDYGSQNKIITQEQYTELRDKLRNKLNNLNTGFDPEIFSLGAQMAAYHIEAGAVKFKDFAERMIADIGESVKPYLKSFYEGARLTPGFEQLGKQMDAHKDVVSADVDAIGKVQAELDKAKADVDTNPTEAQKEAGNYKKGHVTIAGLDITIENPKGSQRSGTDANGDAWSITMQNDYGYIKQTKGKDGDHIDIFIGDNLGSDKVFVVDQVDSKGNFDEHKVMLGFDTMEQAREAYLSNYEDGWTGLKDITETTVEDFKKWTDVDTKKQKAFAEYKQNDKAAQKTKNNTPINIVELSKQAAEKEKAKQEKKKEAEEGKQKGSDQSTPTLSQSEYESFDTRGYSYAIVKDGRVVSTGSSPIKGRSAIPIRQWLDQAKLYDGELFIAPTDKQALDAIDNEQLIMGMTWDQIVAAQQGKPIPSELKLKMPEGAKRYPSYLEYKFGTEKYEATKEEDGKQILYRDNQDFRDAHTSPTMNHATLEEATDESGDVSLSEIITGKQELVPEDFFDTRMATTKSGKRGYVGAIRYGFNTKSGTETFDAIKALQGKVKKGISPTKITAKAYRAVPNKVDVNELIDRDWVTLSRDYAEKHGLARFGKGEYKIIEQDVPVNKLWWDGNDINELGYDTQENIRFREQTETPQFKEWFGDSKVVDNEGKPLVVYHGTKANHTAFNAAKMSWQTRLSQQGPGFYFTNNRKESQSYGKTIETYLSIENPIVLNNKTEQNISRNQAVKLFEKGDYEWFFNENISFATGVDVSKMNKRGKAEVYVDYIIKRNKLEGTDKAILQNLKRAYNEKSYSEMMNNIKEVTGFDGAVEVINDATTVYVAYFPNQIKSATDNVGAFDAENEDIRFRESDSHQFKEPLERVLNGIENQISQKEHKSKNISEEELKDIKKTILYGNIKDYGKYSKYEIVPVSNPLINIYDLGRSIYSLGVKLKHVNKLHSIGLLNFVDDTGYFDNEKLEIFSREFNKAIKPYEEALLKAKHLSTEAAQREIMHIIKDIDHARDYYERLAKDQSILRTEEAPRFREGNQFRFEANNYKAELDAEKNKYSGENFEVKDGKAAATLYTVIGSTEDHTEYHYRGIDATEIEVEAEHVQNLAEDARTNIIVDINEISIPVEDIREHFGVEQEDGLSDTDVAQDFLEDYINDIDNIEDYYSGDNGRSIDMFYAVEQNEGINDLINGTIDQLKTDTGVNIKKYSSFYITEDGKITSDETTNGVENTPITMRIADHTHNPRNGHNDINVVITNSDPTARRFRGAETDLEFDDSATAKEIADAVQQYIQEHSIRLREMPRFREGRQTEIKQIQAKAKADGTYMKAPNGEQTKLNEEQWVNVRTRDFKEWFGDWINDPDNSSKIIDENGEPLVVYHGSSGDHTVFEGSKHYSEQTEFYDSDFAYFSTYIDTAKTYAFFKDLEMFAKRNNLYYDFDNIYKENFMDFEDEINKYIEDQKGVPLEGIDVNEWREYADEFFNDWQENESQLKVYEVFLNIRRPLIQEKTISADDRESAINSFVKYYRDNKHDGAWFKKIDDRKFHGGPKIGSTIITTSPNQIKSATDNVGTFDAKSDDIRFRSKKDLAEQSEKAKATSLLRQEVDKVSWKFKTRFKEAWVDNFAQVKVLQDALKKNGLNIAEHNDYYLQATHIPGKIDARIEDYTNRYQKPLSKAIHDMQNKDITHRSIENYVMLHEGLVRNERMRREAIEGYDQANPEASENARARFIENLPDDYSGLKAIEAEVEMTAQEFIDKIEEKAGKEVTTNLWKRINAATNYSLQKQYEAGFITKETYDKLKENDRYVPLRGHDDVTAEDTYNYPSSMGVYFENPMKKADGRVSRAEAPFAYIGQMAHSAIIHGVKNQHNQMLLRLSRLDDSGLLSNSRSWEVNMGTVESPVWMVESAPFDSDIDAYIQNQENFEKRMHQLQEQGMARQSGSRNVDVGGLFIKPRQAEQHEITVFENGVRHTVYVNANPAIARAINETNKWHIGAAAEVVDQVLKINRQMAANFTTRDVRFIFTNFARDTNMASTLIWAEQGFKPMVKFNKNLKPAFGTVKRHFTGKADLTNTNDIHFREFLMNGGMTGYYQLYELDRQAKKLEREAKKGDKRNAVDGVKSVFNAIDIMNEVIENTTRFASYMTAREAGKTVVQSVHEAKNVSVNFNQKGAGTSVSKNAFEKALLSTAGLVVPSYLFSNANIQGMYRVYQATKGNPLKMGVAFGSYTLAGLLAPKGTSLLSKGYMKAAEAGLSVAALAWIAPILANAVGGDDGEEEYMKVGEWDRQNNFTLMLPSGSFIKYPISHEFRVWYKLGDHIYQLATGREYPERALTEMMYAASDLFPMDPLNALDASPAELAPDFMRPFTQLMTNTNFMGSSIYNEWANPDVPGYLNTKTNKKGEPIAPEILVRFLKGIDHATGGDGVKKGNISLNPDITHHFMRGFAGGLYTNIMQGISMGFEAYNAANGEGFNLKAKDTPARAFYTSKDDLRFDSGTVSREYYDIMKKVRKERGKAKRYKDQYLNADISLQDYVGKIQGLDLKTIDEQHKMIQRIKKMEGELIDLQGKEQKDREKDIYEEKKKLVEQSK